MTTKKSTRREAKPTPSTLGNGSVSAVPDIEDRLFAIACRLAVYTHAVETIDNDEAEVAQKEAIGALPVALGELHSDLMNIVDQLADKRLEKTGGANHD